MEPAAARNDSTRSLAIAALEEASDAKIGNRDVKRSVKRLDWMWGTLLLIGGIFIAGYMFNDWKAHFATKAHAAEQDEKLERLQQWKSAVEAHESARDAELKRMADQIDDIHRYFMRK